MTQTQPKPKKGPMPVYYRVLIILTALLLACIAVGTAILNSYLKIYDETDPHTEAETVFKTYYTTGNYLAFIERSLGTDADEERLNKALGTLLDGKELRLHRTNTGTDRAVYSVTTTEGEVLSEFTLIPTNEKRSFERHLWELSEMTLTLDENGNPTFAETKTPESDEPEAGTQELVKPTDAKPGETVKVTVRCSRVLTVAVNGVTLGDNEFKRVEKSTLWENLPDDVPKDVFQYRIYECQTKAGTPEIVLTDSNGDTYTPTYNESRKQYEYDSFPWMCNDEDAALYAQRAIEIETAIEQYYAYDDINNVALTCVQPDTLLYRELLGVVAAQFVHDGATFADAKASDFIRYDDNTISCRVTMTHTMTNSENGRQRDDYNDVTLVLRDDGTGTYKAYSRFTNK